MPPNARSGRGAKVLLHKPQAKGHLIDDGIVVCAGLVVHAPSSIDELQLVGLCHQLPHLQREGGREGGRKRKGREERGGEKRGGREGGKERKTEREGRREKRRGREREGEEWNKEKKRGRRMYCVN